MQVLSGQAPEAWLQHCSARSRPGQERPVLPQDHGWDVWPEMGSGRPSHCRWVRPRGLPH